MLLVLGSVLLLLGLFWVPLISPDLRSGHRFWLQLVVVDELVAIGLIAAGCVYRLLMPKSVEGQRR